MKNVWRVIALSLLLSAAGFVFVLRRGFDPAVIGQIVHVRPIGFLVLAGTLLGWWLFAGLRIMVLAAGMGGHVTLSRATRAYLLGLFSSSVTPAATGASVAIGWYLARYLSAGQAAGIAVYTVVLDLVFYAWSLPVSFLVLELSGVNLGIPALGVYVVAGAAIALTLAWALTARVNVLSALVWRVFTLRWLRRWRRAAYTFVMRTGRILGSFSRMPFRTQAILHASTLGLFVMHYAVLNAVAFALSIPINHTAVMALQSLIVAGSFLIPTPGGSGYFEIALSLALNQARVPNEAKAFLILMWRLFSYWLYFLIGPAIGGMALLRATSASSEANPSPARTRG